jgi:hypothetical protein
VGAPPVVRSAVASAGWAEQAARGRGRPVGPSQFLPNRLGNIENPLSFSNMFSKFQTNLNSNQI